MQTGKNTLISESIAVELVSPELFVRFRRVSIAATSMLVPETPVNENRESILGKNDIGAARQVLTMQPESKA
jgi:hypothetical protein